MRPLLTLTAAMLLISAPAVYADTVPTPTPPVSASPTAAATGAVTLQYKFVLGQDEDYQMSSNTSGTVNINGQAMPLTQTVTGDLHQIITNIDKDGNGTIKMSFENMKMNMVVNGNAIPIPPAQMEKMMPSFSTTLSPQGKLVGITTGANPTPGAPDMSKMLNSSQMGNMAILPDHPVNIGDSWRGSMNLSNMGMMTYMKMTLNGINSLSGNNIAVVAIKTSSTMKLSSGAASTGQVNALGTMGFDIDNGYMRTLNETMTTDMNVASPASAQGITTPTGGTITLTSSVNMSLVKVSMVQPAATPAPAPASPPANQ